MKKQFVSLTLTSTIVAIAVIAHAQDAGGERRPGAGLRGLNGTP